MVLVMISCNCYPAPDWDCVWTSAARPRPATPQAEPTRGGRRASWGGDADLAAYGDDGDDLMLALARKIVAGEEDAGSVESVFEQARQVEAEAEALLVDEGWHAPEPVAVGVVVAGEAVSDDARERQRSLFSWAEFMAREQDEPPKRRRRHEAPTLSLSSGRSSGSGMGSW